MRELFWRAQYNEEVRTLCKEIEILFILAYCYSALKLADETLNDETWRFSPLYGFIAIVERTWDGRETYVGRFNTVDYLRNNKAMFAIRNTLDTFREAAGARLMWPTDQARATAVHRLYLVARNERFAQRRKVLQMSNLGMPAISTL